jgi:GNAT superfamily N-acetyltransferase
MNKSNVQPLPKVRVATFHDLEDLLLLGHELHEENGMMPLDENLIKQGAIDAINGKASVIAVIGKPGKIEAAIHLAFNQFWYTSDVHLAELWAYVRPAYRKSRHAHALIEFAKNMAIMFKVPLFIGIVSNERTEQKIRMYRRKLGNPAGAYFLFNGKTGA